MKPWDKPLQNLRSSRRAELQERFPDHVINQWLGHSNAVAAKHYLQVTPEYSEKGTSQLTGTAVSGGVLSADQQQSGALDDSKKPSKTPVNEVVRQTLRRRLAARLGLEPRITESESVVLPITLSGTVSAVLFHASFDQVDAWHDESDPETVRLTKLGVKRQGVRFSGGICRSPTFFDFGFICARAVIELDVGGFYNRRGGKQRPLG